MLDVVARSISGHATVETQQTYSSVNLARGLRLVNRSSAGADRRPIDTSSTAVMRRVVVMQDRPVVMITTSGRKELDDAGRMINGYAALRD